MPASTSVLTQAARESSSELLALEADVLAATERERTAADTDQARVDLVGSFAAGVLFDDESIATFQLPGDRPALSGSLGLEVELPLGTSQVEAEHDLASAQQDAALARYEDREQEIAGRVASLRATLIATAERIERATEGERVATELAEAEREGLRLGTGTTLEVLEAQQSERDAKLERHRAQADYASAEAELAHLTGALVGRFAGGRS
jgi:outer membrane protein TolC